LEISQEQPIAAGIDELHLAFLLMDDGVLPVAVELNPEQIGSIADFHAERQRF
jgi:hypothetical protein